jgi:two-component system copper resistance phosphate regulon response regulator CusR
MRILVVEDDDRMADMLHRSLQEQGYAVDVAHDGEQALYQAVVNAYDAVVLDVSLPRRDGFTVAQQLRARGSRVPVLMLTARDSLRDRVSGLDAGADDYLTKPFELDELFARLRALLRRMPELLPTEMHVADLVIDTRSQTVTRGGRSIALTSKEYAMLEYLARSAGRVVSRADLTDHVWDEHHDPFSNAIEVYVNRLRKKIDPPGSIPLIHTHRGAGYRLGAEMSSTAEPRRGG